MNESHLGSSDGPPGMDRPKDAKRIYEGNGYSVYISPETRQVIVEATDYHAGLLFMSASDIADIVRQLGENTSKTR